MPCSIEGCRRKRFGHGWCNMHYKRWRRYGDPLMTSRLPHGTYEFCRIDGCDSPHAARGWCRKHWERWKKHGDPRISLASRPDVPSYKTIHKRVGQLNGPASRHPCTHCDNTAAEWAYDHSDPDELIGTSGEFACTYSTDPAHYVPLCVSCHRRFDRTQALVS